MKSTYTYSFEKLDVWQKSKKLASKVYRLTGSFPDVERFGLISQLRRAAISISSNIAEGSSRSSKKDQARYIEIAYGSLLEIISQLEVSYDLELISHQTLIELKEEAIILSKMLTMYKRSILNNKFLK